MHAPPPIYGETMTPKTIDGTPTSPYSQEALAAAWEAGETGAFTTADSIIYKSENEPTCYILYCGYEDTTTQHNERIVHRG